MDHVEFSDRLLPLKDRIFRFARSILSEETEAEDVTQDIYEKLWARRDSLSECHNLEAFVMSSVKNLCYDRLRSRKTRTGKAESIKNEMPKIAPEHSPEAVDAVQIAKKLIESLPEKQRTVIHLRDVEGYEIDAIAEAIGMDPASVRVVLSRARKSVREDMIKIMNYGLQR